MQIRSFVEAQNAALGWLRQHGGGSQHVSAEPDPDGWNLDDAGFYVPRTDGQSPSSWSVRYWHADRKELTGVLSVLEDGRIELGSRIVHGCLGLFPAGVFRVEPDGMTPVETGYADRGSQFDGDHDRRIDEWYRAGWSFEGVAG